MDTEGTEEFRVKIKVVGGEECFIVCRPETTVRDVKQGIEDQLRIPIPEQKLIYKGKPLPNPRNLKECGIMTDVTLYMVQSDRPTTSIFSTQDDVLTAEIKRYLRKYFNEAETLKIAAEFMKDYNQRRSNLSLDDMERLASRYT